MADLSWSDCGRSEKSQFLYPTKGRKGRKLVGRPSQDELMLASRAKKLKIWRRLFRKIYGRQPSAEEEWAAVTDGSIGRDIVEWSQKKEDKHRKLTRCQKRARNRQIKALADSARMQRIKSVDTEEQKLAVIQQCRIPPKVIRRLREKKVGWDTVICAYSLTDEDVHLIKWAYEIE